MTPFGAMPCTPLAHRLPRVDRTAAAATRLLLDRRLRPHWRDAVDGLAFVPLAAPPGDPVYRVTLETAHGTVEAWCCAPAAPSLAVAATLPAGTPAALLELAAEAALQPVLAALAALGQHDVRVGGLVAAQDPHDAVPATAWVRLLVQGQPVASFVCTRLPDALLQEVRERLLPARFVSRFARSLALPGRLLLSARPVRRAVLDTLVPGDVLLLASGGPEQRVACTVTFGARGGRRWQAAATVDDTFLTIQGAGRMIDEDDDGNGNGIGIGHDPGGLDDTPVAAPADLAVPVRFEVDTVALPLAQIESMAHGYVLDLSVPLANAPIRLVACGRVIGTAELVAVGDRLGARITHMAARDAERSGH